MAKRRQPSGAFFRRFKTYSESKPDPVVKPVSWIRKFHESDGWLYAEAMAFVVVAATIWQIWVDLKDRKTQRIAQAWALVTRVAPGNSGKGPALEFLNSQGIPMVGINLSAEDNLDPSYLVGVNLSGAYLRRARLSEANLFQANLSEAAVMEADLSGANLMEADLSEGNFRLADLSVVSLNDADLSRARLFSADLSGAYLIKTNLSGAYLIEANLSGAYLNGANLSGARLLRAYMLEADLSGAILKNANLSGVTLRGAKHLDQSQLDQACGDKKTILPKGLTIKACP